MSVFAASSSPALIPAIIAAAGTVLAAIIGGIVLWRAQSAEEQLDAIQTLLRDATDRIRDYIDQALAEGERNLNEKLDARSRGIIIGEIVKRALREVLGEDPRGRRWYDTHS